MTGPTFAAALMERIGKPLRNASVKADKLADTDVILRVKAASLCHTDLEAMRGDLRTSMPLVPRHEAAGVVEWTGQAVTKVSKGDHVTCCGIRITGACFYCERQLAILCQSYRERMAQSFHFDGRPRLFLDDGAPVSTMAHPCINSHIWAASQRCASCRRTARCRCLRRCPSTARTLIGCGVMTEFGAATNIARVERGSTVTVIGCSAVGLSAIQGARHAGAARVVAVDRAQDKLAMRTSERFAEDVAQAGGSTHAWFDRRATWFATQRFDPLDWIWQSACLRPSRCGYHTRLRRRHGEGAREHRDACADRRARTRSLQPRGSGRMSRAADETCEPVARAIGEQPHDGVRRGPGRRIETECGDRSVHV